MATYFIVGATRGIGLALIKEALANDQNKVIAGARKATDELLALQKSNPRLSVVQIDTTSDTSVQEAAKETAKSHPQGIDYLVINAAIMGNSTLEAADLLQVLDVNVAGPLRVINAFLPQVKKGSRKVVATVTSAAGSLGGQDLVHRFYSLLGSTNAAYYPYRISKTALNILTVAFAKDYAKEGLIFVPVHPGAVDTDMFVEVGGSADKTLPFPIITTVESAKKQLALFQRLTAEDNGKFYSYEGEVLPW